MKTTAQLHLICGLPGTGKSTFARELERKTLGVCLSHDEWLVGLFGPKNIEEFNKHHSAVWGLLWQLAERLLKIGVDVILDFGLWYKCERDEFREKASKLGCLSTLYCVTCSADQQLRRVEARNQASPSGALLLTPEMLETAKRCFEEPLPSEQAVTVNTSK